jgi:hypothetical protein
MSVHAAAHRASHATWPRWYVIGALIAGTFDICYATSWSYFRSGIAPSRILQSVASGVLGAAAYDGGAATAWLGLGLHYVNAFIITAIFFAAAAMWPALVQRPILIGAAYGAVVYVVMYWVVIPLSRIGPRPFPAMPTFISGMLVHMLLIGVPMVLAARRAFGSDARA